MSLKSIVSTVCSKIHDLLISNEFIDKYKVHPQDFTRNRKLNFFDTTMLVFNKTDKSVRNKLEVENFSGVTPDCIKQDFYATILLKNLASMMFYDCKNNIEKAHNSSKNKYKYKANMSCVLSLIDDYIIKLFYSISNRSRNILLSNIYRNIIHAVIPVRPGRSYLRKKSHPSIKFAQNQR